METSKPVFYLGTHHAQWLRRVDVPLFVSVNRLSESFPKHEVIAPFIIDSGAFTAIMLHGDHVLSCREYAAIIYPWATLCGTMVGAVSQDYMCEPHMIRRSGKSIKEHQYLTVTRYLELLHIAPDIQWIPVIQGYAPDDYMRCIELYYQHGVSLEVLPLVGVGSVCKRQAMASAGEIILRVSLQGINIHAFGYKIKGLSMVSRYISSADSMAWSFDARRKPPLPGHCHKNCANCLDYALQWRDKVESVL